MPKLVTIKAPAIANRPAYDKRGRQVVAVGDTTTIDVEGYVVWLYVGAYRHKFLLQQTHTNEVFLTDYASGLQLGSLTPIKLRSFRSYVRMTDRAAAIELLNDRVTQHGAAKILQRLTEAPRLN